MKSLQPSCPAGLNFLRLHVGFCSCHKRNADILAVRVQLVGAMVPGEGESVTENNWYMDVLYPGHNPNLKIAFQHLQAEGNVLDSPNQGLCQNFFTLILLTGAMCYKRRSVGTEGR